MATKTSINQTVTLVVNKFVAHLGTQGIPVQQAIIYGSWAKGNAKKDSDIDLCIVSENFGRDNIGELQFLLKQTRAIDNRLEPVPFTSEELANPYSTLASEIRTHGIRIV